MNGPGYYRIEYFPYDGQWKITPSILTSDVELSKVYHSAASLEYEVYWVTIDSAGNIPAYLRGANMIEEVIRGNL